MPEVEEHEAPTPLRTVASAEPPAPPPPIVPAFEERRVLRIPSHGYALADTVEWTHGKDRKGKPISLKGEVVKVHDPNTVVVKVLSGGIAQRGVKSATRKRYAR